MRCKHFILAISGLTAFYSSLAFAEANSVEAAIGDLNYGYCWVEKDNTRICKSPKLAGVDFSTKCRDAAVAIGGSRWGTRFSTSESALSADMGQYCDRIWEQQGQLFTCSLDVICPDAVSDESGRLDFGNRVFASDSIKAIDACSDHNAHRIIAAIKRYSKSACAVKVLPTAVE